MARGVTNDTAAASVAAVNLLIIAPGNTELRPQYGRRIVGANITVLILDILSIHKDNK